MIRSPPNVSEIWAIGDANGRGAFTHTSYNDHEIVAANLFDGDHRSVADRITAYGLFIDPPLGRARERSETQGFMKIIIDAQSERILGAAILGIGGDEIILSLLDVMYADASYTVIQRAMHIHPTVSELIPNMLGELEPFN